MKSFLDRIAVDGRARATAKKVEERRQALIIPPAQLMQMLSEYIDTHPVLKWDELVAHKLDMAEKQELWDMMLSTPDAIMCDCFRDAGSVKITGFPLTHLKDIGTKHNGMAVAVQGKVVSSSEREPDPTTVMWACVKSNHQNPPGKYGRQPSQCSQCDGESFDIEFTADTKDMQAIRIQQDNHILSIIIRDESLINSVKAGKTAYVFGVMTFEPYVDRQTRKAKFRKYLEAVNVECDDKTVELAQTDIDRFKADMAQPMFYEKVLSSIAPHIHGMEAAKECIMLALASRGMRKPARMLWIGDPGVAKSELMEYGATLSRNGIYTTMANTRHTGLTTTSEKDEETGRWMVTPGVLAWADAIFLDEFQVIKPQDAKNLNDVIESGKIRYALAGGNFGEIDANCAMVISCNPHQGRVFKNENIQEVLKFLDTGAPAFITRMTLIYFFRDVVDRERDGLIAKAVLENSGDNPLAKYEEDWIEYTCPCGIEDCPAEKIEHYGTKTLRKLFEYITTIPIQPIPEEFHQELQEYYIKNRTDAVSSIMKLISPRFLRDAIKLAQIIARVQGQSIPTKTDIDRAVGLLADNMEQTAFDPETQEIDANLITGSKPGKELKKEKNETEQFWEAYETLKLMGTAAISAGMWVDWLIKTHGWKQEKAEQWISKAEQGGKIHGVANGDIKRIGL